MPYNPPDNNYNPRPETPFRKSLQCNIIGCKSTDPCHLLSHFHLVENYGLNLSENTFKARQSLANLNYGDLEAVKKLRLENSLYDFFCFF